MSTCGMLWKPLTRLEASNPLDREQFSMTPSFRLLQRSQITLAVLSQLSTFLDYAAAAEPKFNLAQLAVFEWIHKHDVQCKYRHTHSVLLTQQIINAHAYK